MARTTRRNGSASPTRRSRRRWSGKRNRRSARRNGRAEASPSSPVAAAATGLGFRAAKERIPDGGLGRVKMVRRRMPSDGISCPVCPTCQAGKAMILRC
jgi:hypothetical protein